VPRHDQSITTLVEEITDQGELLRRLNLCQSIIDQLKYERDTCYSDNCCYQQALAESEERVTDLEAKNQNLREQVDRLDQTVHRMESERLYQRDLNRVPQKQLSPIDKDILAEIRQYNRLLQNDPYAPNRICLGVLASNLGVSDSTAARRVDDMAANGIIRKDTTEPTKADPKTHIDVALTPMLDDPMKIKRYVERNIGGDRTCQCGAAIRNKYSIHVCDNGHVDIHNLPGNTTSYTEQEAFTVIIAGQENIKQPQLELEQVAQTHHHDQNELEQVAQTMPAAPDDLASAQKVLETVMKNYHVEYKANRICKCGSQLWHPDVTGDLACCRCEPIAVWPNSYDEALRLLFPSRTAARATCTV
jgi:hypothetical protein